MYYGCSCSTNQIILYKYVLFGAIFGLGLSGCIGDDIIFDEVDPEIRIMNPVDSIALGSSYQFFNVYFNNVGQPQTVPVAWSSSDPDVISINDDGLAAALQNGSAIISVTYSGGSVPVQASVEVGVGENTVIIPTFRYGTVISTSSYLLEGDFELEDIGGGAIELRLASNYKASTSLPGLYIYLSNNPSTSVGALEIGAVTVFSGAHSYTLDGVGINDYAYVLYYCKPFNVKVGDGEIIN